MGKPQNEKGRLRLSYMIMQDVNYQLFAESVEAECSFGMKEPQPKMVIEVMKELDLYSQRKRHPNTLSGGQKQRVAAAVSMVCGKELFVFDEPTSGLDFDSMIRLADMIQRLSSMGKIIFVVTHDYEFVCQTCTRIIGLEGGMLKDDFPICRETEEQLKLLFSVENKVSSM